ATAPRSPSAFGVRLEAWSQAMTARPAPSGLTRSKGGGQDGARRRGPSLLAKLNAGDYQGAANEFPRWVKAGGRVLQGLVRRRNAEQALFLSQDYTRYL
ncbi:MAG: lysozyme, partial [Leptolyngbya sp. SIO1D8]|nr:lysozyme [Leptolyngbya sp. SIO1D8]